MKELGEIVRYNNKPYFVAWVEGDKVGLTSMCERKYFLTTTLQELDAERKQWEKFKKSKKGQKEIKDFIRRHK